MSEVHTVADVKVGDIVTLWLPEAGSITHRVIEVQPLIQEGYLLETKGDANQFTEQWQITADGRVLLEVARVPVAGYVIDFLGSVFGRALLIGLAAATVATMLLRRRGLSLSSHDR